jgi:hypothetical protein
MNYQTALQSWHDFYAVTGEGAASLVGLLFVGLSLHLRLVLEHADVRALARATFTNFITLLLVALFMVIPEDRSSGTGLELFLVGLVAFGLIGWSLMPGMRSPRRTITLRRLLLRFGSGALAVLVLAAGGVYLMAGDYKNGLSVPVYATMALFVVSLRNSWDLLVTVATAGSRVREA